MLLLALVLALVAVVVVAVRRAKEDADFRRRRLTRKKIWCSAIVKRIRGTAPTNPGKQKKHTHTQGEGEKGGARAGYCFIFGGAIYGVLYIARRCRFVSIPDYSGHNAHEQNSREHNAADSTRGTRLPPPQANAENRSAPRQTRGCCLPHQPTENVDKPSRVHTANTRCCLPSTTI